ncbi:MAG: GNAT family N-acetyltransferase [Gammaproteobacteria bacterium]
MPQGAWAQRHSVIRPNFFLFDHDKSRRDGSIEVKYKLPYAEPGSLDADAAEKITATHQHCPLRPRVGIFMGSIVNVRILRKDDLEGVAALFTASIHGLASEQYDALQLAAWAPEPPDLSEWRTRISHFITLVAEKDGAMVGFLSFEENGHIALLYTLPGAARRGVASTLYREAEKHLLTKGVTIIFTEASLVAAPFFTRHGFQLVEVQNVERRGIRFLRYAMKKQIRGQTRYG